MSNPDDFLSRAQEGIGARFQSQDSIEKANEQREKEWKEAYARLGQAPPKQVDNFVHDGRTLYERLELNKKLNEEEWDTKMKLGNQYRGLDDEETGFLNSRLQEQHARERAVKEDEQRGLAEYRQALAARRVLQPDPLAPAIPSPSGESSTPLPASPSSSPSTKPTIPTTSRKLPPKGAKKDVRSLMKGVVVKKKSAPAAGAPAAASGTSGSSAGSATQSRASAGAGAGTGGGGVGGIPPDSAITGENTSTRTSGTNTPSTSTPRSIATENEMRNSATVGAAGMTALGKRLVQADDSESEEENEEDGEGRGQDGGAEKRARRET